MQDKEKTSKAQNSKGQYNRFFQIHNLQKNIKSDSVRGGVITFVAQFICYLLKFGSTAILARILTPEDYGIVAMTVVVTGFADLFSEGGLSWATIQRQDITHEQVSTLFWINTTLGCLISLALVVASSGVAQFYGENRVQAVTCGLAGTFVLRGWTIQHQALIKRQMRFKALAIIDLVSTVSSIAIGIIMACNEFKYWSLVGMAISQSITKMIFVWATVPWKPGGVSRNCGIGPFLRFGANVMGFNIVNYFSRNLDNILIGRYWGAEQLGLYEKAYNLLLLPISQINQPIASVAVPALSRIDNDQEKLNHYFIVILKIDTSTVTPVIAFIAIFADKIVEIWLGERWIQCAVLFRFLAIAAMLGGLCNPIGWLLVSRGASQRFRNLGIISSLVVACGFLLGLKFGAEGVALGYSAAMCPVMIFSWVYGLKGTNINVSEIVKSFLFPAGAAIIASLLAIVVRGHTETTVNSLFSAGLSGILFCLVYTTFLLIVFRQWHFFISIVEAWKRK